MGSMTELQFCTNFRKYPVMTRRTRTSAVEGLDSCSGRLGELRDLFNFGRKGSATESGL